LGNNATPEVKAAWQALYDLMASTFIKEEKELYAQLGNDERDKGFVPFTVNKKEKIASGTYALTLSRADGGKQWPYNAGQYITLRVEKGGVLHQGHYIPTEPSNSSTYNVVVKEGHVDQNTIVSEEIIRNREVGSTVLVSAPSGTFGLVNDAKHNLFIGGGTGITSLIGLINELNQQGKSASVSVVQCAKSEDRAAFADKLRSTLGNNYLLLTQDKPISKSNLEGKLQPDTHVFVSGSETFLDAVDKVLAGHPKSQVHIKSIEPTLGILKAIDQKK